MGDIIHANSKFPNHRSEHTILGDRVWRAVRAVRDDNGGTFTGLMAHVIEHRVFELDKSLRNHNDGPFVISAMIRARANTLMLEAKQGVET